MKLKLLLYIFILVFFSSCDDFLEEEPKDFLTPKNVKTEKDAEMMLLGTFSYYNTPDLYERSFYLLAEISSDQTIVKYTSGALYEIDSYSHHSLSAHVKAVWRGLYQTINSANFLINKVPDSNFSDDLKDRYIASGKFLRALSYFHLVRLYGGVPLLTEAVENFNSKEGIKRSSEVEVYQQIISDLEYAERILPVEEWNAYGKPTQGAAKTLLAKVYLTMAGYPINDDSMWEKAASKSKEVLGMVRYGLIEDVNDLWLIAKKNSKEHIFCIQNNTSLSSRSLMCVQSRPSGRSADGKKITESGWAMWGSTIGFYNEFSNDDLRKSSSFCTEFQGVSYVNFPTKQPYIQKWIDDGREGEDYFQRNKRTNTNFPIFRYAEVLLINAEAENEAFGPTKVAYDPINEVRNRAGLPDLDAGLSKDQFRIALKKERSFELAFECKRRFDLVRWGDFEEVMSKDKYAGTFFESTHVLYPIPEGDIILNSNLEQNLGYE
ncbi:MAG: hypothetical protein COC06_05765 [Bacteroidales bacterium]|nr:MAG: hypothetical protein COC06_05765 [Bacteroidales bacterium]